MMREVVQLTCIGLVAVAGFACSGGASTKDPLPQAPPPNLLDGVNAQRQEQVALEELTQRTRAGIDRAVATLPKEQAVKELARIQSEGHDQLVQLLGNERAATYEAADREVVLPPSVRKATH